MHLQETILLNSYFTPWNDLLFYFIYFILDGFSRRLASIEDNLMLVS